MAEETYAFEGCVDGVNENNDLIIKDWLDDEPIVKVIKLPAAIKQKVAEEVKRQIANGNKMPYVKFRVVKWDAQARPLAYCWSVR